MPALPAHDPNSGSLHERVTCMASRFFARQSRGKLLALRDTPPMVSFTFDDVPASACETGARILERHDARGTFYVTGGGCGAANPGERPRASIDQLRRVWANGHEIGCHTYSHAAIRYMSVDEIDVELQRNQSALKEIDPTVVVRNFAYPYGDLSIRSKRHLESRYDSCRSTHAGINSGTADLGALDAWPLQNGLLDCAKITELVTKTVEARGWLIFFGHDVEERAGTYGISPGLLEWTVGAAKRAGCVLTTIADSIDLIRCGGICR